MKYELITADNALAECCQAALKADELAIDTEFVRTRTYFPRLGLIQLYDGSHLSLIDPLTINDWGPFKNLLSDQKVTKFLHACSEDLEVFLSQFHMLPETLIDTQILASFSGYPPGCGFASIVESVTGIVLDKSESRTDWMARPLTKRQLDYAAADVYYLLPVARKLLAATEAAGQMAAALSECELLSQRRSIVILPGEAWRDISHASQLRPRQLAVLKLIAAWRLIQARERDIAVNFVLNEKNLWRVARYMPGSLEELSHLGLSGQEIRFHGSVLLDRVEQANALPETDLPAVPVSPLEHPDYKKAFSQIKRAMLEMVSTSGLSQELLASRRQINQLLSWYWQSKPGQHLPELLSGWRAELMGDKIVQILAHY